MAISCFAARSSLAARCSRGVAGQGQYRQYPRRRRRPAPGVAVQWVNVTALGVGSCGRRRATVRRKSIPTVGLLHAWRARRSRSLRVNWLGVPGNWAACLRRSTWRNQLVNGFQVVKISVIWMAKWARWDRRIRLRLQHPCSVCTTHRQGKVMQSNRVF